MRKRSQENGLCGDECVGAGKPLIWRGGAGSPQGCVPQCEDSLMVDAQ